MNISVIVSAGKGERLFSQLKMKKQFFPLIDNKEMFLTSIDTFLSNGFSDIYLVISKEDESKTLDILKREKLEAKVKLVFGGSSREESVLHALDKIKEDYKDKDYKDINVFIHDGDRPFLSSDLLTRISQSLKENTSVIPFTRVNESLYNREKKAYENRDNFISIQTPQAFRLDVILDSFDKIKGQESSFSDEGGVVYYSHHQVEFIKGDIQNIKISDENSLVIGLYYSKKVSKHE